MANRICIIHPYPSRYLLESLVQAEYSVVLVCPEATAPSGVEVEAVLAVPLHLETEVTRKVLAYHAQHPIEVCVPFYEGTTSLCSRLAEQMGLPGNPPEASEASRNKYEAYVRWSRAGVRVPRTVSITGREGWKAIEAEFGYPAGVKLSDSMNSQGVGLVRNRDEFLLYEHLLREMLARPVDVDVHDDRNRMAYGRSPVKLIAQEFCRGAELGVDLFYRDDRWVVTGIFEKAPAHGPFFAETMSVSPSSFGPEVEAELGQIAADAVAALGGTVGAAHVEIRYAEDGPRVLEAGLRPGGGYTMQAVEFMRGINVPVELVRLLKGGVLPELAPLDKAALYGGIVYARSGVLRAVHGLEVFEDIPGLQTHVILHQPGERVYALPESAQPHFTYYLIGGRSRDEVLAQHRRIQETVKLEIAPLP